MQLHLCYLIPVLPSSRNKTNGPPPLVFACTRILQLNTPPLSQECNAWADGGVCVSWIWLAGGADVVVIVVVGLWRKKWITRGYLGVPAPIPPVCVLLGSLIDCPKRVLARIPLQFAR